MYLVVVFIFFFCGGGGGGGLGCGHVAAIYSDRLFFKRHLVTSCRYAKLK